MMTCLSTKEKAKAYQTRWDENPLKGIGLVNTMSLQNEQSFPSLKIHWSWLRLTKIVWLTP